MQRPLTVTPCRSYDRKLQAIWALHLDEIIQPIYEGKKCQYKDKYWQNDTKEMHIVEPPNPIKDKLHVHWIKITHIYKPTIDLDYKKLRNKVPSF